MADQKEVQRLQHLAYDMRKKLITLTGYYEGIVHIGGDLSVTDLLIGLYHYGMKVDPKNIKAPERDRFLLSKGHAAVSMYMAMTLRGYFDYDTLMKTYGRLDSAFGEHPCKIQLPGVECSTGSLGQGLAIAVGMAFSARMKQEKHRVFCMMGDGETCEGEVWEAANTAGSYKLGNLVGIVDRNKQMMTSFDGDYMNLEPYADRWRAFNWNVIELDGHDMNAIVDAIDSIPPIDSPDPRPTVLIAHTTKGKGVGYMEHEINWHAGSLSKADTEKALADIEANYAKLTGGK